MGFPIHTFPSASFETLESSLCAAGFKVEKRATGRSLLVRDGIAQVQVCDYTEKTDSKVHFIVVSSRGGIVRAFAFAPIDGFLSRRVWRHLKLAGARLVDIRPLKNT